MKNLLSNRLLCLVITILSFCNPSRAGVETIPTGSFIVNMGVLPQTYGNGIKPWGMIHDLVKNYKVQFKWIINPSKSKDGDDFIYNATSYRGGTFIIPYKYRTVAVNARISYWQIQGVVGVTTISDLSLDVTYTLKYSPRWTFDFQNGKIAHGFLDAAGIPTASYPEKLPSALDICDDLFVMPHADPTWATHNVLFSWNQSNRGWVWAGCHAVSVLENLFNPANPAQKMNFLSQGGLVPFGSHNDGSPPYSYRFPTDAEMQFMGIADGAMQNGSEQVFLPQVTTWRPSTKVAVYDPTQADVPGASPGEAGAIVYGRAFGDNTRGKVMYTGGHNIEKNTADAVAAMRAFFNFSFLSVYDKVVNLTMTGSINVISLNNYTYRASLPVGANGANYAFQWASTCGGIFSNPNDSVTIFTAPATGSLTSCTLTCTITDLCGRQYYEEYEIFVYPASTLPVNLTSFSGTKSAVNNLLQWKTSGESNSKNFDLEYSLTGNIFDKIATLTAQGTTSATNEYSYLHKQVLGKTAYYRLKMYDRDLNFKYSDVVVIKRDGIRTINYSVYPNPFVDRVMVWIVSETVTRVNIYLTDMNGKILSNESVNLQKGNNTINLEQFNRLVSGNYVLKIKNDEINCSIKLLKSGY